MKYQNLAKHMQIRDTNVFKLLGPASLITADTFENKVVNNKHDIVLLIFSSHYAENHPSNYNTEMASMLVQTKKRFKKMKTKTVRFYALDMNTQQVPLLGKYNSYDNSPSFVLLPAHHKDNVLPFFGKLLPFEFAHFIYSHADIKFNFIDGHHIDWREEFDDEMQAPKTRFTYFNSPEEKRIINL